MTATVTPDRERLLERSERDVKRWSTYIDTLLRAIRSHDEVPPSLGCKLEELRNKRDSLVTKLHALEHHRFSGWPEARREFDHARRELVCAWRTVIGVLDKESLFI